jgi:hypothetical protein
VANEPDQLTQVARERADERIASAIGELHKAAAAIGKKHGIPEGINGHSVDELLGRIAYIPSMARELRRALALELTRGELNEAMKLGKKPASPPPAPGAKGPEALIEPSEIPDAIPVGLDVADLSGITVQTVKALKAAGLHTVGDLARIPDEHLEKVQGLGAKSVAQIRAAVGKASTAKKGA